MLEKVWRQGNAVTVGGNVNWCSHYRKQYGGSLKKKKKKDKLKIELPYNLAVPLLGIYSEKETH